jgi:RNA polymerase sigma-70 factor (ECF subfamily)
MDDRADLDERLVRSSLAGDHGAFAELVAGYQHLVAAVAWRYGVRRQEIEDVVSEVFLKVYRNLHRYRADHPFGTWLYRLATNHVIDHGRRARRDRDRAELPDSLESGDPAPSDVQQEHERAALLRSALSTVRPRYREALFLVYVEGMSVEETARMLGVPVGTVKSRLLRGREALRGILTARHPEHFGG